MKIWLWWRSVLPTRKPPWPPTLCITLKMRMGRTWCTRTSLLIMFGKFEKNSVCSTTRRKSCWANVFRTSHCWWTLLPPPLTYCHTRCDLFWTSVDYWRQITSNVSSYLQNTGITAGWHRMGHVHAESMYRSKCKEVKKSLCDSLIILFSFESESIMGKILRRYVARYAASMHHEWRHCQGCL